jgi:hypothetical protein
MPGVQDVAQLTPSVYVCYILSHADSILTLRLSPSMSKTSEFSLRNETSELSSPISHTVSSRSRVVFFVIDSRHQSCIFIPSEVGHI